MKTVLIDDFLHNDVHYSQFLDYEDDTVYFVEGCDQTSPKILEIDAFGCVTNDNGFLGKFCLCGDNTWDFYENGNTNPIPTRYTDLTKSERQIFQLFSINKPLGIDLNIH